MPIDAGVADRAQKASTSRFNALSPATLVVLFFFAGVVVPIYPFMLEIDGFSLMWAYDYQSRAGSAFVAFLAYSLAVVLFMMQYRYSSRHAKSSVAPRFRLLAGHPMWPLAVFSALMITFASTAALAFFLGGFDQLLAGSSDRTRAFAGLNILVLPQNSLISVGIAWALIITRRRPFRMVSAFSFIVYCVFAIGVIALQGSKATIFVFLVALALVFHYRVKRIALLQVVLLGALLFVLLIAFHIFKQEYLAVGEVVSLANSDGLLPGVLAILGIQWTGNLMQLQSLATLIDGMPASLDYQYGKTLLMVLLILVPSALFPGKPLTAPGVFTDAFWPQKWLDEGTTMPPGYIGEMYMNFGWFGIVAGALLAGHLYGRSMRRLQLRPNCDLTLGSHAMFVAVMLHFFRGEVASVCLLLISIYLPFFVICKLCCSVELSTLGTSLQSLRLSGEELPKVGAR